MAKRRTTRHEARRTAITPNHGWVVAHGVLRRQGRSIAGMRDDHGPNTWPHDGHFKRLSDHRLKVQQLVRSTAHMIRYKQHAHVRLCSRYVHNYQWLR